MMRRSIHGALAGAALALAACSGSISGNQDDDGTPKDPAGMGGSAGGKGEPKTPGTPGTESPGGAGALAPVGMRRLTLSQYRNTIEDLFGAVTMPAVEGEPATSGFTSVGASVVSTSPVGVERYDAAARSIAGQIFGDAAKRAALAGCMPSGAEDAACARTLLTGIGRLLYRRALTGAEADRIVKLGVDGAREANDFWKGMEVAMTALLQSPKFLYRAELGVPVKGTDRRRFSGHELASRLAFFVWNSSPDAELLEAAARGELDTAAGVKQQATRLLASPKARRGFRTFFQELMRLEDLAVAQNRENTLPISATLVSAIREQTLLTFEDALFTRGVDFAEVVRGAETFLNKELAAHYGVPGPTGTKLERVTLATSAPRLGLLGHASFLIKMSNQPDSSPTARGKFIREAFFCQEVPPPPPGVSTELPESPMDRPITMRERLEKHRADPACAGCHAMIDPIGLGLENFDSLGKFRDKEHGLVINPAGELDGKAFKNARELAQVVSQHGALTGCFVRQLVRHATGREEPHGSPTIEQLSKGGRKFGDLVVELVTKDLFLEGGQPL
jgi:hypothetical protein